MNAPLLPQLKQPGALLQIVVTFPMLPMGAVLETATIAISPRGLVTPAAPLIFSNYLVEPDAVRVSLTGGTDGESYLVTVTAVDHEAEPFEAEAEIRVVDLTWAAPDGTTPYLSIASFVTRMGIELAIVLTDSTPRTGRVDKARLGAAILDAQSFVDAYLGAQTTVPLTIVPIPQLVTKLVYDLARANLYPDEAPAGVAAAAADAKRTLRDIANRVVPLPPELLAAAPSAAATPVLFEGPRRTFSRDSLSGM